MTELFGNNAFKLLGLDTTASQRLILKRANEIRQILKIDEEPSYDFDVLFPRKKRSEVQVKDAVERLTNPEKRIQETYFWFRIADDVDENAIICLKNRDFSRCFDCWKTGITKHPTNAFRYRKNLAVMFSILLSNHNEDELLSSSLEYWKELVDDEQNWNQFFRDYQVMDDLNTREDLLVRWRDQAAPMLAKYYVKLSKDYGDPKIFRLFYRYFQTKGDSTQDLVQPLLFGIHDELTQIRQILEHDDEVHFIQHSGYTFIKDEIQKIANYYDRIHKLGLYEDSEVKISRDAYGECLVDYARALYSHELYKETLNVLHYAQKMAGTTSLSHAIQQEIITAGNAVIYKEIERLFYAGEVYKTNQLLDLELRKDTLTPELREAYQAMKRYLHVHFGVV